MGKGFCWKSRSMRLPPVSGNLAALTLSAVLFVSPLKQQHALQQFSPVPMALADGDTEKFKFPPIDRANKERCKFISSAMGQANAARDSLYDLRECKMLEAKAGGYDLSVLSWLKGTSPERTSRRRSSPRCMHPALFSMALTSPMA